MSGNRKYSAVTLLAGGALLMLYLKNKKQVPCSPKSASMDPSKFENRLSEFFFDESLDKAKFRYLHLIDLGLNPSDAYEIVRANK